MSSLSDLRDALNTQEEMLDACEQMLAFDPNEADTLDTKAAALKEIANLKAEIAKLEAKPVVAPQALVQDDAPPPPPKYDMSKHPKFRKASPEAPPPPPPSEESSATVFDVKDVVLAKWSKDRAWYKATIMSKTGSSSDPVYTVKFQGYDDTETKRKYEIRAVHNETKKRKADGSPVVSAPQTPASVAPNPPSNGTVISAAPAVDTSLMQKKEPSKVSDGPTRMAPEPKKLKGGKALEKSKASWQNWSQNGPKKGGTAGGPKKKESMFRTPDVPSAKVGFGTATGHPMTKDQTRRKWNYRGEED